MTIRIDYTPAKSLLSLAQVAGEGAGAERRGAGDLAFTNMILQTQARNAEIAGRLQAQDQAFALQKAAMGRMSRTPTSAAAGVSPAGDSVLDRMKWTQGVKDQQRQMQLDQLDRMRSTGAVDDAEYERLKLNVMSRRDVAKPEDQIKPRISSTQELRLVEEPFKRRLATQFNMQRDLNAWLGSPGLSPEQQNSYKRQLTEVQKEIENIQQGKTSAVDEFRRGGPEIVDPLTGRGEAAPDPTAGVLSSTETAATTGQPSAASIERALSQARMIFLNKGVRNPSKANLMAATRAILAQQL